MFPERAGGCHVEGLGRGGIVAMALAQGQTKAQVTRVEYHPFNSITLSDAEFLNDMHGNVAEWVERAKRRAAP